MTTQRAGSLSFGLLLALVLAGTAHAQDLKIGFVNFNYLFQNHPRTAQLNETLRTEFTPRETELRGIQTELQERVADFQRNQAVMSAAERTAEQRAIETAQRDLERQAQILEEDFQIRQNEVLQELQNEIVSRVQAYVEDEDYDLVVADAVYVSDDANITEDVFEAITEDDD